MLKLMIADDEYRVCQLIKQLIPWDTFKLQLVGVAYDGFEAFRLIEKERPDIVITDIRMPGYDGLTLIEKSKAIDEHISFILVSGHRDFEYAHNALKYGAEDYLLKPVSSDELQRILSKLITRKTQQEYLEKNAITLKKELHKSKEILREKFILDNVESKFTIDEKAISTIEKDYLIDFTAPYFQILIVHIDHIGERNELENRRILENIMEKAVRIVDHFFKKKNNEYLRAIQKESIVCLLNMSDSSGLPLWEAELLHEEIAQRVTEYGDWKVTVCIGDVVNQIKSLHESYRKAIFARRDRIFQGIGKVLKARTLHGHENKLPEFDFIEYQKELPSLLEDDDKTRLKRWLESFYSLSLLSNRVNNPDHVQYLVHKMVGLFVNELEKVGATQQSVKVALDKIHLEIERAIHTKTLGEHVVDILVDLAIEVYTNKKAQDYKPIRIVKEYIESHYQDTINLRSVAKEAGLNPVYLGALFKKETGINFKDYLISIRIDKAKELLLNTDETIKAIADHVGYKDVRYFSKLFMKTVGLTPNEYRKVYG